MNPITQIKKERPENRKGDVIINYIITGIKSVKRNQNPFEKLETIKNQKGTSLVNQVDEIELASDKLKNGLNWHDNTIKVTKSRLFFSETVILESAFISPDYKLVEKCLYKMDSDFPVDLEKFQKLYDVTRYRVLQIYE